MRSSIRHEQQIVDMQNNNTNNCSGAYADRILQAKLQTVLKNVEMKMFLNALIMVAIMIAKNFNNIVTIFKIESIPVSQLNFYVNDILALINPILLVSSSRDVRRMLYCALRRKMYSPF